MLKLKSNKIKSMNDFVAGLCLVGFSIYLMIGKSVIIGRLPPGTTSYVSAEDYIRGVGVFLFVLASIMTVRSINFKRETETSALGFEFKLESVLTMVAVFLYIIFLRRLGFLVTAIIFTIFITCLYIRKENLGQKLTRQEILKKFAFAVVFSLVLVATVYFIFTRLMYAHLP